MTGITADDGLPGEDRLPWLEAVEDEDYRDGPPLGKLIALVLIGLAIIAAVVGGIYWLTTSRPTAGPNGEPELIAAPAGDYKVRPDDPGGMKVEGTGDTAFAASEGADPRGSIDAGALPEAPVARPAPAPKQPTAAVAAPKQLPPAPVPAEPTPAPAASGGGSIQLGAFSSQASANAAWKAMSGRFTYLAPLTHSVVPVSSNGKTLYRLRAGGPDANSICNRLRIAGEQCVAVQ